MGVVSIQKTPATLTASENPIIFSLRSSLAAGGERKALASLTFTGTITGGTEIVFNIRQPFPAVRKFIARNYTVASNEFRSSTTSSATAAFTTPNSTSEIAESLVDSMRADSLVPLYYDIFSTGNTVFIKAKQASSVYTIDDDETLSVNSILINGNNITLAILETGNAKFSTANNTVYQIYVDVLINDDPLENFDIEQTVDSQTYVGTLRKPFFVNKTGDIEFDLAPILKNYVSTQLPNTATADIINKVGGELIGTSPVRGYKVRYGRYQNVGISVSQDQLVKKTPLGSFAERNVYNGAIPFTSTNDLNTYKNLGITGNNVLITNSPNPKLYNPNSLFEGIYFLNDNNLQNNATYSGGSYTFNVIADYKYYDGSSSTGINISNRSYSNDTTASGLYYVNVKGANVGISTLGIRQGKKVKDFTVKIGNNAGNLTQSKTFRLPFDIAGNGTTVVWQSTIGGFDSHYFSGVNEISLTREADSQQTVLDINLPSGFEYNKEYNIRATDGITLNSGWIDEAHMTWIKELISSPKIYIAIGNRYDYYILNGYNYSKNNQTNQFNMEIILVRTIENNSISQ